MFYFYFYKSITSQYILAKTYLLDIVNKHTRNRVIYVIDKQPKL